MSNPYASSSIAHTQRGAPTVRPVSWSAAAIQMTVFSLLLWAAWIYTRSPIAICIGSAIYLAYSFGSRLFFTWAHRRGMRLVRSGRYAEAIPAFDESRRFFTRHAWLDRFRAITMLSPAAMCYREMSLCNMAFCH